MDHCIHSQVHLEGIVDNCAPASSIQFAASLSLSAAISIQSACYLWHQYSIYRKSVLIIDVLSLWLKAGLYNVLNVALNLLVGLKSHSSQWIWNVCISCIYLHPLKWIKIRSMDLRSRSMSHISRSFYYYNRSRLLYKTCFNELPLALYTLLKFYVPLKRPYTAMTYRALL